MKDRFGEDQAIINAHYMALMNIKTPTSHSIMSLHYMYDELERHFRSLEALGQDVSSPVFVSMILSKLPKEVLIQLEIGKPHHDKWTVHVLRDELCHYITAREAAERQSGTGSCDTSPILRQPSIETGQSDLANTRESTQQTSKLHNRSTAEALLAGSREQYGKITKVCVYCNGQHWSDECSVFSTIEARKEKIKGRCYICLARGHMVRECPCDKLCYYCSQKKLVRDMSAEQFLLCLRRFIAQRGAPSEITSDNASHFKLAKTTIEKAWNQAHCATEVQTYISSLGIHWKFITELSPWMGGFYERLVGLVKRALRKSLGSLTLHFDQLQTLIYEISAVLN